MHEKHRCTADPFFMTPPWFQYHIEERHGSGGVFCGWGTAFARLWKALYSSTTWLEQELYPRFEQYAKLLPAPMTEFQVHLRDTGPMFTVFPGENGCQAGVAYGDGTTIERFYNHNIDTQAQTITLFTLASIWFSLVAERVNLFSTLEGIQEHCDAIQPEHDEREIFQRFITSPRYDGELYRIPGEGLEHSDYYMFAFHDLQATHRVTEIVGDRLFNDHRLGPAEKISPLKYPNLPILVPLPGTEPE